MADYPSDMAEIPVDNELRKEVVDGTPVFMTDEEVTVYFDGESDDPADSGHDANLALSMDKAERRKIAEELINAVDIDEEARAGWKRKVDDGLELLGLSNKGEDDAPFPGASAVNHPLIAEAIIQFQARALPELVPSDGPVKATNVGETTEEEQAQAERVAEYVNWRLMVDDPEWFDDTDQLLFYLPFGGSAFRKLFVDPVTGKACSRYIKAEDFIVPYKAKSLAGAQRYTHSFEMHGNDLRRAIAAGRYVDINIDADTDEEHENDPIEDTSDLRDIAIPEGDVTHRIYEVHCYRTIPSDEHKQPFDCPYIITVDVDALDVLSIRRNWAEDDDTYQKQVWFSHYKFMPGFGFYGFGFLHLMGSLAKAATGALRALLDAAARENMSGGFKSKEARNAHGDATIEPGTWKDIDLTAEELQRAFYTPHWPQPSPALFQLLGALTDAGQRISSTTEVMTGDANPNAPVGTTVALIEQGQKIFSAIHRRLHRAAGYEYRLFAKLDAANLGDEPYPYDPRNAEASIRAEDFSDKIDVVPVSDPNIVSSTQRVAMAQAVVQLTESAPDIYGQKERREAHERLLRALHVPDIEAILPEVGATRLDPVTENQYMMVGRAVQAFAEQDHAAHIKIHESAAAQFAGAQGQSAQRFGMMMQAHLAEHYAHAYRQSVMQAVGSQLPGGLEPGEEPESLPIDVENMVAAYVAQRLPPVPTPADRAAQQEQSELSAEQQRKNAEFAAEQKRKQAAWMAEQKRKQTQWATEQQRDANEFTREQQQDVVDFTSEQQREQADWETDQVRQMTAQAAAQSDRQSGARNGGDQGGES